jgi:hypothetical protein
MDILDDANAVVESALRQGERERLQELIEEGLFAFPELQEGYTSYQEAYQAGMFGPLESRQEWRERANRIWDEFVDRARSLGAI